MAKSGVVNNYSQLLYFNDNTFMKKLLPANVKGIYHVNTLLRFARAIIPTY